MKITFASDHAGFELKNNLVAFVQGLGHEVHDSGPLELVAGDDYPLLVEEVVREVVQRNADRAIILGGSGQGEAMAANRIKGIRAAVYYGSSGVQVDASLHTLSIVQSVRAHNDANILSLGARFISLAEAQEAVVLFLETPFSGEERHQRRNHQLDELV